jgi:ABC-type Zn uptake system ZnuABC Zn-binding protein ZnuA
MKKLFFAIVMIFTVILTSCQDTVTEETLTSQDTPQVDTTVTAIDTTSITADTTGIKADTACCSE